MVNASEFINSKEDNIKICKNTLPNYLRKLNLLDLHVIMMKFTN